MIGFNRVTESSEGHRLNSMKKWDFVCKCSNIILSVLYVLCGWIFGFLGVMFLSLGVSGAPFTVICSLLSSILFLITPVFCFLGIFLSVIYRKRETYLASFLIQFLPFGTLGVALVLFFLSII